MRFGVCLIALLLAACGGGGGDIIDMTDPADLKLREEFRGLAAADMDGNGFPDLIAGSFLLENRQILDSRIAIYRQNPASPGQFLPPSHHPYGTTSAKAHDLATADLQLNGLADVIATSWDEGGFRAFQSDNTLPGSLLPVVHYPLGPANSSFGHSQAIADIDADGFPDVVRVTDETVYWFPQDGGNLGEFLSPIAIGPGMDDVVTGDMNNDGLADIVVLRGDGILADDIAVYLNNTNSPSQFLAPITVPVPITPDHLGLADFDDNGLMDIAVGGQLTDLDYNPADDGRFMAVRQYAPNQFAASDLLQTAGLGIIDSFGTGNLNGNRFPDVALHVGATISIIEVAAYQTPVILSQIDISTDDVRGSAAFGSPVIADLNNDTLDDIAFMHLGLIVTFQVPGRPGVFGDPVRINTPL